MELEIENSLPLLTSAAPSKSFSELRNYWLSRKEMM
jgi:hypothetical protein